MKTQIPDLRYYSVRSVVALIKSNPGFQKLFVEASDWAKVEAKINRMGLVDLKVKEHFKRVFDNHQNKKNG